MIWILSPFVVAFGVALQGCAPSPVDQFIGQLSDPDPRVRSAAIVELGQLGEESADAVVPLSNLLEQPDPALRRMVCASLAMIGAPSREAVPRLVGLLSDPDRTTRLAAAYALVEIAPENSAPVAVLDEAIRSGDVAVAVYVGGLGERAAWAVPELAKRAANPRQEQRVRIIEAIGKIGPAAKSAEGVLQQIMKEPDSGVHNVTTDALRAIRSEQPAAKP